MYNQEEYRLSHILDENILMSDVTSQMDSEDVLEYSPIQSTSCKLVDCQGQPLDNWERMETSFMEFLDSVRVRAIQSGTDIGHVEDTIVRLVQSEDEFQQVKLLVSDLMNRNQSLDSSLSEAVEAKEDHETRSKQLEYELERMKEQLELVMREADDANQLLESKYGREKQMLESERRASKYRTNLEQENQQLLSEANSLRAEADVEKKERELIRQCFEQLGSANMQIEMLNVDYQQRQNANTVLEDRVQELTVAVEQMQDHQVSLWQENKQLKQQLHSSHESQSRVARHVMQLESVNEEYKALIGDTQSQLHDLKSKTDILIGPVIPLSTELHSVLHSTPLSSPDLSTETRQELVPINEPNGDGAKQSPWSPRDSSDSDSFICISDPKQKPVYSERFRARKSPLPKSKSVTFRGKSDTETTDEDQCKLKTKRIPEPIANIIHGSLTPEPTRKTYVSKNLLSNHGNVKLVKTVDGSVHLEKWRELATSKNESWKQGIKRKSLQSKFGGSLEDMSTLFSDNSTNSAEDFKFTHSKFSAVSSKNAKETLRNPTGILGNLTETIGQLWKWKT